MLPPDDNDFLRSLMADIRQADEVRSFMLTDAGQSLANMVEDGLDAIKRQMLTVNVGDTHALVNLQAKGRAFDLLKNWISCALDSGDSARFMLDQDLANSQEQGE